jgi:hypothetical protein
MQVEVVSKHYCTCAPAFRSAKAKFIVFAHHRCVTGLLCCSVRSRLFLRLMCFFQPRSWQACAQAFVHPPSWVLFPRRDVMDALAAELLTCGVLGGGKASREASTNDEGSADAAGNRFSATTAAGQRRSRCEAEGARHSEVAAAAEAGGLLGRMPGGVPFVRIDGSHTSEERRAAVAAFRSDARIRVALLSITAACVGLDFSSASVVVFVELPDEVGRCTSAQLAWVE